MTKTWDIMVTAKQNKTKQKIQYDNDSQATCELQQMILNMI